MDTTRKDFLISTDVLSEMVKVGKRALQRGRIDHILFREYATDGYEIVATDTHVLILDRIGDCTGEYIDHAIDPKSMKNASIKESNGIYRVMLDHCKAINPSPFPKYEQVIPTESVPYGHVGEQGVFLANPMNVNPEFMLFAQKLARRIGENLLITGPSDGCGPLVIKLGVITYLVMPISLHDDDREMVSDWADKNTRRKANA